MTRLPSSELISPATRRRARAVIVFLIAVIAGAELIGIIAGAARHTLEAHLPVPAPASSSIP